MSHLNAPTTIPSQNDGPLATPNQPLWEWSTRIRFNPHELGCSFSVCLFLGEPPKDPADWLTAPNFAGAHHAYVSNTGGGGIFGRSWRVPFASGTASGVPKMDEGFVVLNPAIARLSGLGSFDPEVVVPYLTDKLTWRVQKTNTEPAELRSLEIVVFATPLSYAPGEPFPVPGERHEYGEITRGKPGGCCL